MIDRLLQHFGFVLHALGTPPTEEQQRNNSRLGNRAFWLTVGVSGSAIGLALCLPNYLGWPGPSILLLLLTLLLLFAIAKSSLATASNAPLAGTECRRLLHLTREHPEIHAHVAAINAQVRPITLGDWCFLHYVAATLQEQIVEAPTDDCVACRELYALENPHA